MAVAILLAYIFGDQRLIFNQLLLLTTLIVQTFELLYFITKTNRKLASFFRSIEFDDYTVNYKNEYPDPSFEDLQSSFQSVIDKFEALKAKKEQDQQFFMHLIEQIPLGILTLEEGEVILLNSTGRKILDISSAQDIDELKEKLPELNSFLNDTNSTGSKFTEIRTEGYTRTLLIDASAIHIGGRITKVLVFKDIENELNNHELEAWLKLIRILTHEIMNSATPIISMAETMEGLLRKGDRTVKPQEITETGVNDLLFGIQTIGRRSKGMMNFVEDYRELTRVPAPKLTETNLVDLVKRVLSLLAADLQNENVEVEHFIQEDNFMLDPNLMEQVLVNLITNSIYALKPKGGGKILLNSQIKGDWHLLIVSDTGIGISEKDLPSIFIPFYSTRKGGSGIGLSLARQIMYSHGGNIFASSKTVGAEFTIRMKRAIKH